MKMSYVTSNILIVCFGIKKCMLWTKRAIAPYSKEREMKESLKGECSMGKFDIYIDVP